MDSFMNVMAKGKGRLVEINSARFSTSNAKENRQSAWEVALDITKNHVKRPLSPATVYTFMKMHAKWEGWVGAIHASLPSENPDKEKWNDAYHKDVFTLGNVLSYAMESAMNGVGKGEDGVMQLNSVFHSIKCLMFKDEVKELKLEKEFLMSVRNGLLNMSARGLLSTTGMPKRVISVDTIQYAVKKCFEMPVILNFEILLQSTVFTLLLMYTGIRPGSVAPPLRMMDEVCNFLRWKDISIFRNGTDFEGHVIYVHFNFRHMKGHTTSFSSDDASASRCIRSTEAPYTDLPLFLMIHGFINNVFDTESVESWYSSRLMMLSVKEEWQHRPVFHQKNMIHVP